MIFIKFYLHSWSAAALNVQCPYNTEFLNMADNFAFQRERCFIVNQMSLVLLTLYSASCCAGTLAVVDRVLT